MIYGMYWINPLSRGVPRAFPMCTLQTTTMLTWLPMRWSKYPNRGISYWFYSNVNNINFYEHKPIHSGPCLLPSIVHLRKNWTKIFQHFNRMVPFSRLYDASLLVPFTRFVRFLCFWAPSQSQLMLVVLTTRISPLFFIWPPEPPLPLAAPMLQDNVEHLLQNKAHSLMFTPVLALKVLQVKIAERSQARHRRAAGQSPHFMETVNPSWVLIFWFSKDQRLSNTGCESDWTKCGHWCRR